MPIGKYPESSNKRACLGAICPIYVRVFEIFSVCGCSSAMDRFLFHEIFGLSLNLGYFLGTRAAFCSEFHVSCSALCFLAGLLLVPFSICWFLFENSHAQLCILLKSLHCSNVSGSHTVSICSPL